MAKTITGWVLFAAITGLYVFMVIAAIGNMTQLPEMASQLGLELNPAGWFWLWFGVCLPPVGFLIALLAGIKRKGGARLLLLATGLAVVAAIQLEVSLIIPPTSFFM